MLDTAQLKYAWNGMSYLLFFSTDPVKYYKLDEFFI